MDSSETLGGKSNGALPNISGKTALFGAGLNAGQEGCLYNPLNTGGWAHVYGAGSNTSTTDRIIGVDASFSSSVYQNNITKAIPSHQTMLYCVKF